MQRKPSGETRLPTGQWAGYGFSKSMPDSAIRERLQANNARYVPLTTTYEGAEVGHPDSTPSWRVAVSRAACPLQGLNGEVDPPDPWKETPAAKTPSPSSSFGGGTRPFQAAPGDYPSPRRKPRDGGRLSPKPPAGGGEWLTAPKTELSELFAKLGLERYTELFQQQEVISSLRHPPWPASSFTTFLAACRLICRRS